MLTKHVIGFLKGRFQCLKNLRLHIADRIDHILATYWVSACIGIHAFATRHEAQEKKNRDDEIQDPFIDEGLSTDSNQSDESDHHPATQVLTRLQQAKLKRENLKKKLFESKLEKLQKKAKEHQDMMDIDIFL